MQRKIKLAIIILVAVVGLVGCLGTQPAHAFGLFGKTVYSVRFTAQAGVYLIVDGNRIVGRGLVSTGDKFSGEAKVVLDGKEFRFIKRAPYNFELPFTVEQLADGLPHSVEIYCTTYRPYSKDWKKRGKHLPDWGAAASATFLLQKVQVRTDAEEEIIARQNAEMQLGRNNEKVSRSDADDLASFFNKDANSSSASASAAASANASSSTDNGPGLSGQAGETQPDIATQPAPQQSGNLVLQFKPGQGQTIRLIDRNGRQIGPDHTGQANNNNGGAIIIRRDQLPIGGSVVVITQTSRDRGMMQRTVPITFNFSGRTVDLR